MGQAKRRGTFDERKAMAIQCEKDRKNPVKRLAYAVTKAAAEKGALTMPDRNGNRFTRSMASQLLSICAAVIGGSNRAHK